MRVKARWSAVVCFLIALAIYIITLAPDLVWRNYGGDGGELITASVTLGVPHPPGYPTYVLVGKLFSLLPLGTVAYRFHLLSAVSMAAAAGLVTSVIQAEPTAQGDATRVDHGALAGGLAFAFAPLAWSQATIAEVYGLNLLCLAALIWTLSAGKPAWLAGILLGLSVTTHLTSLLMVPVALRLIAPQRWPRLALGALVGLAPLTVIPALANGDSPVMWGDPSALASWWWLVTARLYHSNIVGISLYRLAGRAGSWLPILLSQATWAGPLILIFSFRLKLISHQPSCRWLLATAVAYVIYAFGYDSNDAIVLTLPALLILAILQGPAMRWLGAAAYLVPIVSLMLNYGQMDLSREPGVRPAAEQLLQSAPKDAILLTPGDNTIFALWYFQHVEKQRLDLVLVDANLLAFDWYRHHLQRLHPDLQRLEEDDLDGFRVSNQPYRPFCFADLDIAGTKDTATSRCL